jgi:hypothetical protein
MLWTRVVLICCYADDGYVVRWAGARSSVALDCCIHQRRGQREQLYFLNFHACHACGAWLVAVTWRLDGEKLLTIKRCVHWDAETDVSPGLSESQRLQLRLR